MNVKPQILWLIIGLSSCFPNQYSHAVEYKKIVHRESGKCLDIAFDNNELILFDCTGDDSQFWDFNFRGSGHLESKSQPGQCITFSPDNGAVLGECDKGETGWNYKNLMFSLRSKPNMCLDNYMNQNVNYNKLITFTCWPENHKFLTAQKWILA